MEPEGSLPHSKLRALCFLKASGIIQKHNMILWKTGTFSNTGVMTGILALLTDLLV
jgi:hypothetical protein